MFTGIIETLGVINKIEHEQTNVHLFIESSFTNELKIDQSVAHNGVCLTVVEINDTIFKVTAIKETIDVTTIGNWNVGDVVNLERGMFLNTRLDGHIVQGHVDETAVVTKIEEVGGSTYFSFEYDKKSKYVTIEKGSITVDGTSLTVVNSGINTFSVAIIPYTLEHTLFKTYKVGTKVNLEFDVIGKYVTKLLQLEK
ncbi:riboflavin synthase [Flavobacterium sp. xlx-214]|uniref:riboflavin synthase n=1 Tax=unclassified Flavobacterium TaxID=196869 RepID=UPI0013D01E39|nr:MULTISPECIES: riboflavin synthase [unclassified Flavobacterium]MBA5793013.1 riboflavin synthase [Flavobacterium sp. xlx-221]QMI84659.1 riboflavin synthase [Flavobacterium sp. xlx-214]